MPAHLESGAAIPNPAGRTVEIVNAKGLACCDSSKGSSGCGGPDGVITSRTEQGQTRFSVRDPSKNYADNQGFFEFEAILK